MSGNDTLLIGNVRFNKDDVKSSSVGKDSDGDNVYSVFLKNGTQIKFRDQKASAKAQVTVGYDQGNEGKYGTAFSGIVGLSVQGSDKDDYYHLYDCDYYYLDVTNGGKDEVRVVNTKGEPKSATIKKDSADKVYNVDTSHGISRSEGWFTKYKSNPDDEVKPREDEVKPRDDKFSYNLPQPLANAKDIPEKSRLRDPFYFQFVKDGEIFEGAFAILFSTREQRADGPVLRRNVTTEEDGSLTYVGTDMANTPVKVNVKHNPDGTTMLKITESTRTEPNKIQIVDSESGTLLYDKYTDGTQTFYNADGSQSIYNENNVLLHRTKPFEFYQ